MKSRFTSSFDIPCSVFIIQKESTVSTIGPSETPFKKKLDLSGRVQFGGVLKELKNNGKESPTHPVFLEVIFWMKR